MRSNTLTTLAGAVACSATSVTIPASVPAGAIRVDPSFPGTSFELSTFSLYAQTSPTDASPNQYSINLIKEVFKRTGARPLLRVGGDTADSVAWDSSLTQPISPAPGTSQTGPLTIGPQFWGLTQLLAPTNALWMPQISYTDTNYVHAEEIAESIRTSIGSENIGAIEIGNEPNEYGGHTGPSATDAQYFATRFQEIAANVTRAGSFPGGAMYAGPDLASYDHRSTDWTPQDLFQNTDFDATGNIKYATDHWYRCLGAVCNLAHIIAHGNTVIDTGKHIEANAAFFNTYKNGDVKYFLNEINIQSGGTGSQAFSYSFATALYGADFMMYLMSLGVAGVNWEQVYSSNQNVWQPSTSPTMPAQTKNVYYALITAAEFIGTSGATRMVELVPGGNDGLNFSSYVAFDNDRPARVALCNLNYWDVSDGTTRPSFLVEVDGVPSTSTSVTVKYLTNSGGAAQNADHTTFGGSQWPYSSLGAEVTGVQSTTIQVPVQNGKAQVPVDHSAIAIVYL
ncbi:Glycoside hydrolase, superfamily [Niveomyces insectorum RCEF 264]|uniref:Glycoside hydrolase, superfamily n=1 Tax=Niveomyces insectorum RCEF 264 TaxID=1081102 RepID=A0A167UX54_9HYPO|nr:Glycoside hydrolase, superfamily [Niveomyces insectorum RCEF 264]